MPQSTDLSAFSKYLQPIVNYSLNNFLPETILVIGFLLTIILDLMIRSNARKQWTGYLALIVFVGAGIAAGMQWNPFHYTNAGDWKGGSVIFPYVQSLPGPQFVAKEGWTALFGMTVVDNFAVFFKLLISATGVFIILMSLVSREVTDRKNKIGEYHSLLLAMAVGMFLMPASTDLIMMYISLELVSIASYIMAGFMKDNARSTEASMKYVLYGAFSSGLMLYGFSILYGLTGTTNIIAISQVLSVGISKTGAIPHLPALWFAVILSLAGLGYKISAAPFHFWTPDVYEGAPIPVTALLSVASKAAGFGLAVRFLLFTFPPNPANGAPILDWPLIIAVLSALTMTLGNFAALQQSNIKRMLAYSTIAHAGYMLIGLVAAGAGVYALGQGRGPSDAGVVSIVVYFIAYLFTNVGAFYVVMLIANKIGSEEIEDYRGLAQRTPLLCVAMALFLVSLTGIPLTIGFVGKLYIFTAILQQPHWMWLAVVAILNSVVSLYYYVRVMAAMFIKQPEQNAIVSSSGAIVVADGTMTYPLSAKVLLFVFLVPVIIFGIYFQPVVDFATNVIRFFSLS